MGCKDKKKTIHGIQTDSPMVVTLGQQYNVGEKPTPLYCTLVNRHAGTSDKKKKENRNDVVVHHQTWDTDNILFHRLYRQSLYMVFKRFPDGSNLGSTVSCRKPTVTLYTYINRHAGTPEKKQKQNRNNVVQHPTW